MPNRQHVEHILMHHGVKGMKWGVRKERSSSSNKPAMQKGSKWQINADGSIDMEAGAQIQRVVRNHKGALGGKASEFGLETGMYASFTPEDNASYEHGFGRKKSITVKEASNVVKFTAQKPLHSPSPAEASKIYLDMLRENPELQNQVRSNLHGLAKKKLDTVLSRDDPKANHDMYSIMYDAGNYSTGMAGVNKQYISHLQKKGYNMILDPSDAGMGFHAPVVIFGSQKNLKVTSRYVVDKSSQKKVSKLVREQWKTQAGKDILHELGYT